MAAGGVGYFAAGYWSLDYWHVNYWAGVAITPVDPITFTYDVVLVTQEAIRVNYESEQVVEAELVPTL